jgi:hypothetical protein
MLPSSGSENKPSKETATANSLKSIIFWDVTPCNLLICNRRFGGTYRLHLQGRREFQQEPACKQVVLAEIFFDPEDGGDMFIRNVGCISTDYTAPHPRR